MSKHCVKQLITRENRLTTLMKTWANCLSIMTLSQSDSSRLCIWNNQWSQLSVSSHLNVNSKGLRPRSRTYYFFSSLKLEGNFQEWSLGITSLVNLHHQAYLMLLKYIKFWNSARIIVQTLLGRPYPRYYDLEYRLPTKERTIILTKF